ncbi:glycogen/starch synthase, partial [Omnitrophica bacterium]|nr:glycogen/starch synthase [Candidatus Omnitrophota bacterium]
MNPNKNHRYLYLLRFTALIIAGIFSVNSVIPPSYAQLAQSTAQKSYVQEGGRTQPPVSANVHEVAVPSELGSIREAFQGSSGKVVFYLQDAHSAPDAQRSIFELVRYLSDQYDISAVALEGAQGDLDSTLLKSFPDREQLKKVMDEFLSTGELAGGAVASVFQPEIRFTGIEDWDLYQKGIDAFLKALSRQPQIFEQLESEEKKLNQEKQKTYSRGLYELDQKILAWEADETELLDLIIYIYGKKKGKSDPARFEKITAVLEEFQAREQKSLKEEIENLLQSLKPLIQDSAVVKELNGQEQSYRTGRLSPGAFSSYLVQIASRHPEARRAEGAMTDAVARHQRLEAIQGPEFFKELERLINDAKESLFRNTAERELDQRGHELKLLWKLARLELTRDEWRQLSLQVVDPPVKPGDDRERPVRTENSLKPGDDKRGHVIVRLDRTIQDLWSAHLDFYRIASARDQALFENLQTLDSQSTILVTGGFHTLAIIEKFKKKNISYVLISPAMNATPDSEIYFQHMQGNVSWKKYFRTENGKVNLYDAFHRAVVDRLANGARPLFEDKGPGTIKFWRDSLIRGLAEEGRIEQAGRYTRFLDESTLEKNWTVRLNQFIDGLRGLKASNQLTDLNIAKLLSPAATTQTPVGVLSFANHAQAAVPPAWVSGQPLEFSERSENWLHTGPSVRSEARQPKPTADLQMRLSADYAEAKKLGVHDAVLHLFLHIGDKVFSIDMDDYAKYVMHQGGPRYDSLSARTKTADRPIVYEVIPASQSETGAEELEEIYDWEKTNLIWTAFEFFHQYLIFQTLSRRIWAARSQAGFEPEVLYAPLDDAEPRMHSGLKKTMTEREWMLASFEVFNEWLRGDSPYEDLLDRWHLSDSRQREPYPADQDDSQEADESWSLPELEAWKESQPEDSHEAPARGSEDEIPPLAETPPRMISFLQDIPLSQALMKFDVNYTPDTVYMETDNLGWFFMVTDEPDGAVGGEMKILPKPGKVVTLDPTREEYEKLGQFWRVWRYLGSYLPVYLKDQTRRKYLEQNKTLPFHLDASADFFNWARPEEARQADDSEPRSEIRGEIRGANLSVLYVIEPDAAMSAATETEPVINLILKGTKFGEVRIQVRNLTELSEQLHDQLNYGSDQNEQPVLEFLITHDEQLEIRLEGEAFRTVMPGDKPSKIALKIFEAVSSAESIRRRLEMGRMQRLVLKMRKGLKLHWRYPFVRIPMLVWTFGWGPGLTLGMSHSYLFVFYSRLFNKIFPALANENKALHEESPDSSGIVELNEAAMLPKKFERELFVSLIVILNLLLVGIYGAGVFFLSIAIHEIGHWGVAQFLRIYGKLVGEPAVSGARINFIEWYVIAFWFNEIRRNPVASSLISLGGLMANALAVFLFGIAYFFYPHELILWAFKVNLMAVLGTLFVSRDLAKVRRIHSDLKMQPVLKNAFPGIKKITGIILGWPHLLFETDSGTYSFQLGPGRDGKTYSYQTVSGKNKLRYYHLVGIPVAEFEFKGNPYVVVKMDDAATELIRNNGRSEVRSPFVFQPWRLSHNAQDQYFERLRQRTQHYLPILWQMSVAAIAAQWALSVIQWKIAAWRMGLSILFYLSGFAVGKSLFKKHTAKKKVAGGLATSGPYRYTQNPVHLAYFLGVLGFAILNPGILSFLAVALEATSTVWSILYERNELWAKFKYSPELSWLYQDYVQRTPVFFPYRIKPKATDAGPGQSESRSELRQKDRLPSVFVEYVPEGVADNLASAHAVDLVIRNTRFADVRIQVDTIEELISRMNSFFDYGKDKEGRPILEFRNGEADRMEIRSQGSRIRTVSLNETRGETAIKIRTAISLAESIRRDEAPAELPDGRIKPQRSEVRFPGRHPEAAEGGRRISDSGILRHRLGTVPQNDVAFPRRSEMRFLTQPKIEQNGDQITVSTLIGFISRTDVYDWEFLLHYGSYEDKPIDWIDWEITSDEIKVHPDGTLTIETNLRPAVEGPLGFAFYARNRETGQKVWQSENGIGDTPWQYSAPASAPVQAAAEEASAISPLIELLAGSATDYEQFKAVISRLVNEEKVRGIGKVLWEAVKDKPALSEQLAEHFEKLQIEIKQPETREAAMPAYLAIQTLGIGEVVFVASEGPHAIAGGLAKVIEGLTKALDRYGISVTVITPLYEEANGNKHKSAEEQIENGIQINGDKIQFSKTPAAEVIIPLGPVYESGTHVTGFRDEHIREFQRHIRSPVYETHHRGVRYLFMRHARFADKLYAKVPSDEELRRAVFLSRGALEMLRHPKLKIDADIVFSNDWVSALIPPYLEMMPEYQQDPELNQLRTVHMIHNYGRDYQGRIFTNQFGADLWPLLGMPNDPAHYQAMADPNDEDFLNMTAAAIRSAQVLLTVSSVYAEQILTEEGGEQLHELLGEHGHQLFGISNGLDLPAYQKMYWQYGGLSPEDFNPQDFVEQLPEIKKTVKQQVQADYGLNQDEDAILISLVGRIAEQKGLGLLTDTHPESGVTVLEHLLIEYPRVQYLIGGPLAEGDPKALRLREVMKELQVKYPGRIQGVPKKDGEVFTDLIPHREALRIMLASNFFLMPSRFEPGGITQIEALSAGTAVIGRKIGGIAATLTDYTDAPDTGNAFLFSDFTGQAFFEASERAMKALEANPHTEGVLIHNAAMARNNWDERVPVYRGLLQFAEGLFDQPVKEPYLQQSLQTLLEHSPTGSIHPARSEARDEGDEETAYRRILRAKIKGKERERLSDEGRSFKFVYRILGTPLVEKKLSRSKENVRMKEEAVHVMIARQRLNSLAARSYVSPDGIIQEFVFPLVSLKYPRQGLLWEVEPKEGTRLIDEWATFPERLAQRGVFDIDLGLNNVGVNLLGHLKAFDFGLMQTHYPS